MTARSVTAAFAAAATALTHAEDTADTLLRLLSDCTALTKSSAATAMVRTPTGELEVLSSTSHRAADLEAYQIQQDSGPCRRVVDTGTPLVVASRRDLQSTWPDVGPAIVAAGYGRVIAQPLAWRRVVYGGLNLFGHDEEMPAEETVQLAEAFAGMCSAVVVAAGADDRQLASGVRHARESRVAVEQAKGVLAHRHGLDMEQAYDRLVRTARQSHRSLTAVAVDIVTNASGTR